jgi:hypothetical protein
VAITGIVRLLTLGAVKGGELALTCFSTRDGGHMWTTQEG